MVTTREVLEFGIKFFEYEFDTLYTFNGAVYCVQNDYILNDAVDVILPFHENADEFLEEFYASYQPEQPISDDDDWWMNDPRWWGDATYHGE